MNPRCLFYGPYLLETATKMAPRLFVLGATGYIGGDALYEIASKHPELEIAALVRNSDKGAQVASQHSKIRLVYGSLDDEAKLEEEAKKADIVLNCAHADHEVGAKALARGLASRSMSSFLWNHAYLDVMLQG